MILLMTSSIVNAATITHIYELNGSFADTLGGSALVPAGGSLNPTNYSFSAVVPNEGLALSNGLVNNADYSIETIFNFNTLSRFRKIIATTWLWSCWIRLGKVV